MTVYTVTDSERGDSTIGGYSNITALLNYILRERAAGVGYDPQLSDPGEGVFILSDGSRVEVVAPSPADCDTITV